MPLEIEVKFHLAAPEPMRLALLALGARSQGRHLEHNLRLEDRSDSLRAGGSILRLRRDRRCTLTFKSRPAQASRDFKVAEELEVEVSDGDTMAQILLRLGFAPVQSYEKWRETLRIERCTCCLDEMPFGHFLEIEGPAEEIRPLSARLGLAWERRIMFTYLQIFEMLRQHHHLPGSDLTFDAFRGRGELLPPLLHRVEAGGGG
jgi:adenylate cyclase class 2